MKKNVGIKSERLYYVSSLYGVRHEISLICREYRCGRRIYILKYIVKYYDNGEDKKKVYKKVFDLYHKALEALKYLILDVTIDDIEFKLTLPF